MFGPFLQNFMVKVFLKYHIQNNEATQPPTNIYITFIYLLNVRLIFLYKLQHIYTVSLCSPGKTVFINLQIC